MATAEQIRQKDQKWANKSWKPFLWMAIGGTVSLIIGIVLLSVGAAMMATTPSQEIASMLTLTIFGYILIIAGGFVLEGGVALIIVTIIKRNKARERLGLPKK